MFSESPPILLEPGIEFRNVSDSSWVRDYVELFADIYIGENALIIELAREWYELDILVEENDTFIRFYWHTTA